MIRSAVRYWHTLRHLRPVQFYGRLWFRAHRPRPDTRPAPSRRPVRAAWCPPARRQASLTGPGDFLLLGQAGSLGECGWDGPGRELLWRYHQHYFDDLNARDAGERCAWHRDLVADWIRANPPGAGVGWHPYPVSLRIVNWVKWAWAGNQPGEDFVHSLAVQARWLRRRLEHHLLGNHLLANAKALVFAGLFFDGEEAQGWLRTGAALLRRELAEQVLADGGHFERSPMYHALVLEDVLDVLNAAAAVDADSPTWRDTAEACRQAATSMCAWLDAMCHPDGEIAFFNDAAIGMAPAPAELFRYAADIGIEWRPLDDRLLVSLDPSGYLRAGSGPAVAFIDVAPVGPDYLPGHAHADTLSFELSVFGQRVLVNSGTSLYGAGPERLRQRGTAAHNTVVIDGEDSSEVWGGFRVARRARPRDLDVSSGNELRVSCTHDGYDRLPGRPRHRREWRMADGELVVSDQVTGRHRAAEARYHLHPDLGVEAAADARRGVLRLPGGERVDWCVESGRARLEPATWHPRFGETRASTCLAVALDDGRAAVRFAWG